MSVKAGGVTWLREGNPTGLGFFGMDWGKPGDDETGWWVVNPEAGRQGFRGTGPMMDARKNSDGVWEIPSGR